MFNTQEIVPFQCPVLETGLTASEIQELLSLFQSGDPVSTISGSQGSNQAVCSVDERKRKRKISNRESAQRSRIRKKRHLENLTNQVNRLKVENRELKNRLKLVINQSHIVCRENDQLRSECFALWARLSNLCRVLATMQLQ